MRPPLDLPKKGLQVGPNQQLYGSKGKVLLVGPNQQHYGSYILAWNQTLYVGSQ